MMYKIMCNPLHLLYGAFPVPYVPVRDTRSATSAHLCASSLQNLAVEQNFYSLFSISVERSYRPRIRWRRTGGFHEQGQCLFISLAARSLFVSFCFPFLFFILWVGTVGLGSPSLTLPFSIIIISETVSLLRGGVVLPRAY